MEREFQPIPALNGTIKDIKSMISQERDAFTLAETLITLAIIGVVAAISLPSLLTMWQDRSIATAKKKAKNTLANGYARMIAESESSWEKLPLFKCGMDFSCLSKVHRGFLRIAADKSKTNEGFPEKYTKSNSADDAAFSWSEVPYIFATNDGAIYGYGYAANDKIQSIDIVVDVNGSKEPNKICKDVFRFVINNQGEITDDENMALCKSLDEEPAGQCSIEDVGNCSPEEASALYETLDEFQWGGGVRFKKFDDNKCLVMIDNDDEYARSWLRGANQIQMLPQGMGNATGVYVVATPGSHKSCYYPGNDDPANCADVYATYCN